MNKLGKTLTLDVPEHYKVLLWNVYAHHILHPPPWHPLPTHTHIATSQWFHFKEVLVSRNRRSISTSTSTGLAAVHHVPVANVCWPYDSVQVQVFPCTLDGNYFKVLQCFCTPVWRLTVYVKDRLRRSGWREHLKDHAKSKGIYLILYKPFLRGRLWLPKLLYFVIKLNVSFVGRWGKPIIKIFERTFWISLLYM